MDNYCDYIKEEMVEYDGTNFYCILSKKEIDELKKILDRHRNSFRIQQNALSSLMKRIILNTYLFINNNEVDIDEDIKNILKKKYYKDLDSNISDSLFNDTKLRDFIVELVRIRTLKKYINPVEDDNEDELEKKQFRLSNEDTEIMSIIMGSSSLTRPEYISSLIRYFLRSHNRREILYYENVLTIEKAVRDKEYVVVRNRKIKPALIINSGFEKRILYFNENPRKVAYSRLLFSEGLNSTITNQKYSISALENKIITLINENRTYTVSYELTGKEIVDSRNRHMLYEEGFLSPLFLVKRTIKDNVITSVFRYDLSAYDYFKNCEEQGYIKNLKFNNSYIELRDSIIEYESH